MKALLHISIALLCLTQLSAVEILEADQLLSGRLNGEKEMEAAFGSATWGKDFRPHDYLVGSIGKDTNVEGAALFAFRVNQPFLDALQDGGKMQFMFTVPSMHEGDAQKALPVDIQLLKRNAHSALDAATSSPVQKLGSISNQGLEVGSLYKFTLDEISNLQVGDLVWIGLNGRNPLDGTNHNFLVGGDLISLPGSVPPMLVAGSKEDLSETVQGMSFLTLLHGHLNAPKQPEENPAAAAKEPRWVNPFTSQDEIDRLQMINRILRSELEKFPIAQRQLRDDSLGFHSSVKALGETWTLRLPVDGVATALCLVPSVAVEGEQVQPSAFPKRFSIIARLPDGAGEVVVADWTHQDFPLRNSTPVVFSFPWQVYESIEFTIHKGVESDREGGHFFSLEELFLYRPIREKQVQTIVEIADADSTVAEPFWSPAYLTDGRTSLGPAVMEKVINSNDTIISFDSRLTSAPEIILELPRKQMIFGLDLHPIINSEHPALSAVSFPPEMVIEFSDDSEFKNIVRAIEAYPLRDAIPVRGSPVNIRFEALEATFIKLRFKKLDSLQLGLAEIRFNDGRSLADSDISLNGFPSTTDSRSFIDNHANGYRIGDPLPWMIRLIRRDVVNAELVEIEASIESLQKAKQRTSRLLLTGIGGISVLLFSGILFWQKRKNAAENMRVRWRIQQDLHDEIGSNLGTVSLITSHLLRADLPDEFLEELGDAHRSAREATSSLREVIWLTDKTILTLDKAFAYIRLRAEQMVHDCELIVDIPETVPARPISSIFKRNLFLLFTEIIHNSQKHANANQVVVKLRLSGSDLTMTVTDDGRGFDLETVREGIGLRSMRERANQLGGELEIDSTPKLGTTVQLTLKLTPAS